MLLKHPDAHTYLLQGTKELELEPKTGGLMDSDEYIFPRSSYIADRVIVVLPHIQRLDFSEDILVVLQRQFSSQKRDKQRGGKRGRSEQKVGVKLSQSDAKSEQKMGRNSHLHRGGELPELCHHFPPKISPEIAKSHRGLPP